MAYQGNSPAANFQSLPAVQRFNGTGSATAFTLSSAVANDQSLLISVDGVVQDSNAYAVSGTTLTFTAAPSAGTGNIFVNTISPVGSTVVPPDGSVTQAKVAGEAINESKLQVSNNPTNGLFLSAQSGNTGGLTWAEASAGKMLQVVSTATTNQFSTSSNTLTDCTPMTVNITPSATSSKVLVLVNMTVGGTADNRAGIALQRGSTDIFQGADSSSRQGTTTGTPVNEDNSVYNVAFQFLDSPSSTSELTYHIQVSAQAAGSETLYLNRTGTNADAQYTKHTASSITVMEIGA